MSSPQMLSVGRPVPTGVVLTNRVIWAALLASEIAFAVVTVVLPQTTPPRALPVPTATWMAIDAGVLVVALAVTALFGRWAVPADAGETAVAPRYRMANIVPMAALDGASYVGLTGVLLAGSAWPLGVVPAVAFAVQLLRFPPSRVGVRS